MQCAGLKTQGCAPLLVAREGPTNRCKIQASRAGVPSLLAPAAILTAEASGHTETTQVLQFYQGREPRNYDPVCMINSAILPA